MSRDGLASFTARINGRGVVTVPEAVRFALDIDPGDILELNIVRAHHRGH